VHILVLLTQSTVLLQFEIVIELIVIRSTAMFIRLSLLPRWQRIFHTNIRAACCCRAHRLCHC